MFSERTFCVYDTQILLTFLSTLLIKSIQYIQSLLLNGDCLYFLYKHFGGGGRALADSVDEVFALHGFALL